MPYISIHTFLAEGDKAAFCDSVHDTLFQSTPSLRKVTVQPFPNRACALDFNPHLPCGRWLESGLNAIVGAIFQSTPSLRKVTGRGHFQMLFVSISIHTFLAEGDRKYRAWSEKEWDFNPHLPCGRWPARRMIFNICSKISIHTFLAEGDREEMQVSGLQKNFNPHLPCGRWPTIAPAHRTDTTFQSTPSLRKVTYSKVLTSASTANFNPHLPCGRWRRL